MDYTDKTESFEHSNQAFRAGECVSKNWSRKWVIPLPEGTVLVLGCLRMESRVNRGHQGNHPSSL